MSKVTPVQIIGAGFSGLSLAHALKERNIPVEIFERESRVGGLIQTRSTEYGLVESAANALIADASIEDLFSHLGVKFAGQKDERKNRYIFWDSPKKWPVSFRSSMTIGRLLLKRVFNAKAVQPQPGETIRDWSLRVGAEEFGERLLEPALQGIYAGDPKRMSASLILGRFFAKNRAVRKGRLRGSVSPANGMEALIKGFHDNLEKAGVPINFQQNYILPKQLQGPVVICTSAWGAAEMVKQSRPALAEQLMRCESLPLVSSTLFFKQTEGDLQGFGCLFPKSQEFNSLGVLFNNCVFEGRSNRRSETWIMGGEENLASADSQLEVKILKDRARISKRYQSPLSMVVTRWPKALPHYTVEWEKVLDQMMVERPLFLHGNYLGSLGLGQIYLRSRALAHQLESLYGS